MDDHNRYYVKVSITNLLHYQKPVLVGMSLTSQVPDDQISHSDALAYWYSIPPTVNGMLGGYPQISRVDLRGSANFLEKLLRLFPSQDDQKRLGRGVDCGAGIGRITAGLLSKFCTIIDVVEPIEKFAKEVKTATMLGNGQLGETFVIGLEDWIPEKTYDLIWNQWCLGHLTDKQLVVYFQRCRKVLNNRGWIVVKENMSSGKDATDIFDKRDSSVTRTDRKFREIFEKAELSLVKTELQAGFPKELYPVRYYALQYGR